MVREKALLVACVCTGDKYPEIYVHALKAAVERHMPCDHEFMCFSDRQIAGIRCKKATLPGWWAKLHLFELAMPTLYFDLDVIITADLAPLVEWDGFGIIWDYLNPAEPPADAIHTKMFNSSVMKLTGNQFHVWEQFCTKSDAVMSRYERGGDQRWITARMPNAKTFPTEWFPSYKFDDCKSGPPDGALAVIFHGHPKMPDFTEGWVPRMWPQLKETDSAS